MPVRSRSVRSRLAIHSRASRARLLMPVELRRETGLIALPLPSRRAAAHRPARMSSRFRTGCAIEASRRHPAPSNANSPSPGRACSDARSCPRSRGVAMPIDGAIDQSLDIADLRRGAREARRGTSVSSMEVTARRPGRSLERIEVEQRLPDPAAQQARAHRRAGLVEYGDQTVPLVATGAFGQFEVAAGLGVECHVAVGANR